VRDGWAGYGQVSTWEKLYAFDKGSFRLIFEVKLSDSNGASLAADKDKYGWEMAWNFSRPAPNGSFDIVLKADPRNSYPRPPGDRKEIPLAGIYRYDGTHYKHLPK
jgi:hypothetical protein